MVSYLRLSCGKLLVIEFCGTFLSHLIFSAHFILPRAPNIEIDVKLLVLTRVCDMMIEANDGFT
jgi:hypothetical protein